MVTHWLISKDNGAKAANLPRAAMSADIQAMEGNMMVGGDLGRREDTDLSSCDRER